MAIQNTSLTSAPQEIILGSQGDPNNGSAVTVVYICNGSGVNITFNVYAVPSGFSWGPSNIMYDTVELVAGDTYVIDSEKLILSPGDSLWANCNVLGTQVGPVVATVSFLGI